RIDLARVEQPRAERREPVDALGAHVAAAVGVAQVVHGEVVGGRHPGHVIPGRGAVDPAGPAADDQRHLTLEGQQRASRRPGHWIIAGRQRGRRLEEVRRPGRYRAALERAAPVAHVNRDDLRGRGIQHYGAPQTSSAVSTTRRSLAICSSRDSELPSSVEEKPHCGDRHSWSMSTNLLASSIRRLMSSLTSSSPFLLVTKPRTTYLPFGTKRSGAKPPERSSSNSMK